MSFSCYAMLHNATILSKIFLHLPMRDILVSIQRTCRLWRNVVRDTDRIQKALFLRPIGDKGLMYTPGEKGTSWFGAVGKSAEIFEHPLVTRGDVAVRRYYLGEVGGRVESSWRRMLCSQPAVKAVLVSKWVKGEAVEKYVVAKGVGVTLGEIVDAFEEKNVFYMTIQGYQMWQPIRWTTEATWPLLAKGTKGVRRGKWREVKAEDDVKNMGPALMAAANRARISADAKLRERYDAKMKEAEAKRASQRSSYGSSKKS